MFCWRVHRPASAIFERCQVVAKGQAGQRLVAASHRLQLVQAEQKKSPWMECRRSLHVSQACSRTFMRQFMTKNRPKAAKPRYAEDRKTSEIGLVLAPGLATNIVLRAARREDCEALLRYLYAQAEWEGCPDEMEITIEDLIRDGFGDNPCFQCAIAEACGKDGITSVIGYAMYCITYCAWKGRTLAWENMFIHPDYRDFGIGSRFLYEICKAEYEQGCRRVVGYIDNREIQLKRWYTSEGFKDLTHKHHYHIYSTWGKSLEKYVQRRNERGIEYSQKAQTHCVPIHSLIGEE